MERQWVRAARQTGPLRSPVLGVFLGALLAMVGPANAGDNPSPRSDRKQTVKVSQVSSIDKAIAEAWDKAGVKPAQARFR